MALVNNEKYRRHQKATPGKLASRPASRHNRSSIEVSPFSSRVPYSAVMFLGGFRRALNWATMMPRDGSVCRNTMGLSCIKRDSHVNTAGRVICFGNTYMPAISFIFSDNFMSWNTCIKTYKSRTFIFLAYGKKCYIILYKYI